MGAFPARLKSCPITEPCPGYTFTESTLAPVEIEVQVRQDRSAFEANCVETSWVEAESAKDGRCDLVGADSGIYIARHEGRVGQQQDYVGVVMRKAAVLGELGAAAGVGDADVGGDNDVGRARIAAGPQPRPVVIQGQR